MINEIRAAFAALFSSHFRRKLLLLAPLLYGAWIAGFMMLWHLSFILIDAEASYASLGRLLLLPLAISIVCAAAYAAVAVFIALRTGSRRRRIRAVFYTVLVATALLQMIVRMIDWGTLYFGGQHTDNEFWYHAFYSDGSSFLLTPAALGLIASIIIFLVILVFLARAVIRLVWLLNSDSTPLRKRSVFAMNALIAGGIGLITALAFAIPSGKNASERSRLFVKNPERMVIGSFIEYMILPPKKEVAALPAQTLEKLRRHGVALNSVSADYPLLKRSIYLDPKSKVKDRPVIPANANVIVVFVESLSRVFVDGSIPETLELTKNFQAMKSRSIAFQRMYNADYPTLRGMIAALGSGTYEIDKVQGIQSGAKGIRPPILARYLFLSDILKEKGYRIDHVQGASATFVGMGKAFTERQGYDKFYSLESLDLIRFAKHGLAEGNWGIRDEDVFGFTVKLLSEKKPGDRFMISVSTIDMHPPFDPLRTHPAAGGNGLLNALYSTDAAFGVFWNYFINSPWKDNTVVVLVADHAMGPNNMFMNLLQSKGIEARTKADFIPCYLYIPQAERWHGRDIMTVSTNLDILPTLLDLMNEDIPNPFLGLSVFADRRNYPAIISSEWVNNVSYITREFPPDTRARIGLSDWTPKDQKLFVSYMRSLTLKRRIYADEGIMRLP